MNRPSPFLPRPAPARPRPPWRGVGPACLAMLAALGVFAVTPGDAAEEHAISKEYQVKAAFLYNFTKFVEWPPRRFANAAAPIVIGVLGAIPLGRELESIVRDRKVNGRGIVIVYPTTAEEAKAAHAVFIAAGEEKRMDTELATLISEGVLVVGESGQLAALGSTIVFKTVDDKVRFEIDLIAAERAGLKISSQLLKLATHVRRQP